jgi:hypothetical protein
MRAPLGPLLQSQSLYPLGLRRGGGESKSRATPGSRHPFVTPWLPEWPWVSHPASLSRAHGSLLQRLREGTQPWAAQTLPTHCESSVPAVWTWARALHPAPVHLGLFLGLRSVLCRPGDRAHGKFLAYCHQEQPLPSKDKDWTPSLSCSHKVGDSFFFLIVYIIFILIFIVIF